MPPEDEIEVAGLVIRPHEHSVLFRDNPVVVTPREFEILTKLASHPGWVFSLLQLCEEGDADEYSPESVSVHVARLRHKLEAVGAPDVLETVRGFGYRLKAASAAPKGEAADAAGSQRALRDAAWQLQEAALEAEHLGTPDQYAEAAEALDQARKAIYAILAK